MTTLNFEIDLRSALVERRKHLEASFVHYVRRTHKTLESLFGESLRGVSNSPFYSTYKNTISPLIDHKTNRNGFTISTTINECLLKKASKKYADGVIEEIINRVEQKTAMFFENPKITEMSSDGLDFTITGIHPLTQQPIQIRQRTILNHSSLGNPFNQYPARIKLNNKAISSAELLAIS